MLSLPIEVEEDPFNERNLFATLFTALRINPDTEYVLPGLPTFNREEKEAKPIHQVLN